MLTGAQARGIQAQATEPEQRLGTVHAFLGAFLRTTRIAGSMELMLGGEASLRFREHFTVGAAGGGLLEPAPLLRSESDLGLDLRVGYGGLVFGYEPSPQWTASPAARVLVGAGNAEVRAIPVGNRLGSDNFLVVEPEARLHLRVAPGVFAGLAVGYRMVFGVQDLPDVSPEDLRGLSLTASVFFGG